MSSPKPRVVIIDDNIATCTGLAEVLEIDGFEAFPAFTGGGGLYFVRTLKPDAVLLDVNIPDMSGFEVCDAIRDAEELDHIAIVFHSAVEAPSDLHGADAFLTYPVPLDILASVLRATIERRNGKPRPV